MEITYLGHAGFLIETKKNLLIMDPWLNSKGAFCKSWYQYPKNNYLFDIINNYFSNSKKNKYIYISHEHQDHFDQVFLNALKNKNFNFIIPKYRNELFKENIYKIQCKKIIECFDTEIIKTNDLSIQLFIDDTGINRDSAIVVSSDNYTFLNMNDCKIYEKADEIKSYYNDINVLAFQFSGATWYPICYDFTKEQKYELMLEKKNKKFELVLSFLNKIQPDYYIPSSGPPCFLSNELKYINFIKDTQFPHKEEFVEFLKESKNKTNILSMYPGCKYSLDNDKLISSDYYIEKLNDLTKYIEEYSKDHYEEFSSDDINIKELFNSLIIENLNKMKNFERLQLKEPYQLFFLINENNNKMVKVDFNTNKIKLLSIDNYKFGEAYYKIEAPAWLYKKVLDREISWADFSLTFRAKVSRNPNIYSSFVQGFILSEIEDCKYLLEMIMALHNQDKRTIITTIDNNEYEIDRYCPHSGADLKNTPITDYRYVVCPRHGWKFDLFNKGNCKESHDATINVVKCIRKDIK